MNKISVSVEAAGGCRNAHTLWATWLTVQQSQVIKESSKEEYEEDLDLDIVDHEDALEVLHNHNEILCGFETNEDSTYSSNKLFFRNCLYYLKSYWYIESLIIDEVILIFAEG